MEPESVNITWVLALQLTTLASIATGLLLYLVCSGRNTRAGRRKICGPIYYYEDPASISECGTGKSVLVTACDGALGLQVARHLHSLGFRVFAGFREPASSSGARFLVAATIPSEDEPNRPPVCPITLDVTREDLLHEAVGVVRQHLPADQQGLWGVVNTAGLCCRGRLEGQDGSAWDAMFRLNVVGTLRAARALLPLLRNKKGRLINLGAPCTTPSTQTAAGNPGLVAYTAVRYAVEGASAALRAEVAPLGIHVISLQPESQALPERLFASPRFEIVKQQVPSNETTLDVEDLGQSESLEQLIQAEVLPLLALRQLEEALLAPAPRETYRLSSSHSGLTKMWVGAMSSLSSYLHRDKNKNTSLQQA